MSVHYLLLTFDLTLKIFQNKSVGMPIRALFFFAMTLTALTPLQGQTQSAFDSTELQVLRSYEDTLGLLSFLVVNDSLPENRFLACHKLIKTLVKALKTKNSFQYPFERMRSVSILYPADSTFRIFTWQLYVDVNEYRYYGAIQLNTPELKLLPLIDRSFAIEDPEQAVLPADKWYGALYYNIYDFDTPEGRKYLLFGYNADSLFQHKKLLDVLTIRNGQAIFGAPVFVFHHHENDSTEVKHRLVFSYSSEASFKMNYDESMGMVVYDHLTPMGGTYGQGLTMVPDGTYEGLKLSDGKWQWVPYIENQILDEAPRPEPILDERKNKDLMGREKKKGNY